MVTAFAILAMFVFNFVYLILFIHLYIFSLFPPGGRSNKNATAGASCHFFGLQRDGRPTVTHQIVRDKQQNVSLNLKKLKHFRFLADPFSHKMKDGNFLHLPLWVIFLHPSQGTLDRL